MKQRKSRRLIVIGIAAALTLLIAGLSYYFFTRVQNGVLSLNEGTQLNTLSEPVIRVDDFMTGITQPVDIIFPNQELMIYGTKDGTLTTRVTTTNQTATLLKLPEIATDGERGLQSLAVDREFFENRFIFACYNANSPDRGQEIRISRFKLSTDTTQLTDRIDILTGVSSTSNRNQGCAMGMDRLGYLWVGIGDVASPTAPRTRRISLVRYFGYCVTAIQLTAIFHNLLIRGYSPMVIEIQSA